MKSTRKEAKEAGDRFYFTGLTCKNGHIAKRRTLDGCCNECEKASNNTESRKEYIAKYAKENYNRVIEHKRKWEKNNRGSKNARKAIRRSAELKRTPAWLTDEEKTRIKCYYQLAAMRSRESEQKWHVDHIVPLQGKTVSGLHVPWNLRVIPARENISKGNRFHE